jgi:hypothetical protein
MKYKPLFIFFFFAKTTLFAQNFHFQKNAPDSAITIRECIALLEKEEQKYSEAEQRNTKLMITRLRKIFYGFNSWDKYLIKGVANIKSPYENIVEQAIDASSKSLQTPNRLTIKLIDTISFPTDSTLQKAVLRKNIFSSQEIRLENNSVLDIGHVLCGIDASNHRHAVRTPRFLGLPTSSIKISNNMNAVTWIGDLGSFVAEAYFEKRKKGKLSAEKQQELLDIFMSSADILGDIDAYSILEKYDLKSENGKKVSEIFANHYLPQDTVNQQDRYKMFIKSLGFKEGISAKRKAKLIRRYSDEVSDSAAFYTAISARNVSKRNLIKAIPLILKMSINPYAKKITKLFFEQLENNCGK